MRGAVSVASRLGVSPLLIALMLVGFGTSTPELVTSLQAAFDGLPGIAVGNVVGSNVANVLLILGVAAIIAPVAIATLRCVAVVSCGSASAAGPGRPFSRPMQATPHGWLQAHEPRLPCRIPRLARGTP